MVEFHIKDLICCIFENKPPPAKMLTLQSLSNESIELPYIPEMAAWDYLKHIIAPAAGFRIVNNHTVEERVVGKMMFNFANRLRPLKEFADDGDTLGYVLPLGPSNGQFQGNASGSGGGNMECPICLENTFDFALGCLHRGHVDCFKMIRDSKCPLCRVPFTQDDKDKLFPALMPGSIPNGYVAVDINGTVTEAIHEVAPVVRNLPLYYHEPTQRMLSMLGERYPVEINPENEDEYYGAAFDEYRIFTCMNGVVEFRFHQYNVSSYVRVRFMEEDYRFTNDVDAFAAFLEGRMHEIVGPYDANFDSVAVWNDLF